MNLKKLIAVVFIGSFFQVFSQEIDSLSQKKIEVVDSLVHQKELEENVVFEEKVATDSVVLEEVFASDSVRIGEKAQEDTLLQEVKFIRPALFIDYGKILTLPFKFETKAEVGIELLFVNKIPLIAEFGYGAIKSKAAYDTGNYESKGMYGRVGTGYLAQLTPKNKIGLTARYALSQFEEKAENAIRDKGLKTEQKADFDRKNLKASWTELVVYSDRKINKFLSLGLNLRLRFLIDYDKLDPYIYTILGYGASVNKVLPAANLFIRIGL